MEKLNNLLNSYKEAANNTVKISANSVEGTNMKKLAAAEKKEKAIVAKIVKLYESGKISNSDWDEIVEENGYEDVFSVECLNEDW